MKLIIILLLLAIIGFLAYQFYFKPSSANGQKQAVSDKIQDTVTNAGIQVQNLI